MSNEKNRARHTMTSLISATGKSKRTIKTALDNGWFGPVEIIKGTGKIVYYVMAQDAIKFYMEKKYEKQVVVKNTSKNNFFAYKYTLEEATDNANKRADVYMENKDIVRLELLNKPEIKESDIREKVFKTFLKEESEKIVKVVNEKMSIADQRKILELPLDFPTMMLEKMTPSQSVYAMEKVYEYIHSVGDSERTLGQERNYKFNTRRNIPTLFTRYKKI